METKDIIGIVVVIIIGLGLIGMSVPLLMGKWSGLIAGFNTMSPEEKDQWDAPALCRFTGKILLATGLLTVGIMPTIFFYYRVWLVVTYIVAVVGLSVFAVVWCNTGNRFRK